MSTQLDDYLRGAVVTDDDPGVALEWIEAAVDVFVIIANKAPGGVVLPALPAWITSAQGAMSRATFTNDVVTYCAAVGGGPVGVILIAPNDFRQYHHVSRRFQAVEMDGYVQACMAHLAGGLVLCRLYYLVDRTIVRAQPLNCAPPPGFRMVFS
jgi:hypothetical protein